MANQIVVNAKSVKSKIDKNIYGHFSEHLGRCIYDGFYVGENSDIPNVNGLRLDIIEAMKKIKTPVLRWPGGCFADEYHWKDGIGPKEKRPSMINTHWGGVVEDNSFGTHEFFDLCEKIGCEPYICGNVGSGTVQEMSEWIEYMTFDGKSPMADLRRENGREKPWKLKYFGVGNENWGCGGRMRAEYYADEVNRYNTYARDYGENKLYRIGAGPRNENYHWTEELMKHSGLFLDAIALHYYTRIGDKVVMVHDVDGNERYLRNEENSRGSATDFKEDAWFGIMKSTLHTDTIVKKHSAIMDKYDPKKQIGLMVDEWGTWWDEEPGTVRGHLYQQNTLRDAFVASLTLDVFHKYTDRIKMTNIAQIANVLQSMILTKEDKMVLTPTYHVFEMYKVHQDATYLPLELNCERKVVRDDRIVPMVSATASRDANGFIHISLSNVDLQESQEIELNLGEVKAKSVTGRILTANNIGDYNSFEKPSVVAPKEFTGAKVNKGSLKVTLPAKSIVVLEVK